MKVEFMLQRSHCEVRHIVAPAVATIFYSPLFSFSFFFCAFPAFNLTGEPVAHISREAQVYKCSSVFVQICETQLGISLSEMKDSFLLRSFTTCPWAILKNVFTRLGLCEY